MSDSAFQTSDSEGHLRSCHLIQATLPCVSTQCCTAALQAKIQLELEADSVSVKDTYGDGKHVSIEVVSNIFEGQSSMKRQRMVYKVCPTSVTRCYSSRTYCFLMRFIHSIQNTLKVILGSVTSV